MGLLMNGRTDLGQVTVRGLMRVPYPPTKMSAFIIFIRILQKYTRCYKTYFE